MWVLTLYNLLLIAASPAIAAYLAVRAFRSRDYRLSLPERLGWTPPASTGGLWLHAVSVGEVISSAGLIRAWKRDHPLSPVVVSVGTIAGRKLAGDRLRQLADVVIYAPLDFPWVVRRLLNRYQPRAVVIMETEIWPNLWRETKRSGAALIVVNGRISDKAFPKYLRMRWFFEPVLNLADALLTQTGQYTERYCALGAAPERVIEAGNLKYDFSPPAPAEAVRAFLSVRQPRAVWIAASTMPPAAAGDPDEDEAVVDAFAQLRGEFPDLVLLLAPRRPERFAWAAQVLRDRGIPFARRTELPAAEPGAACLLLDSIGELGGLFALADVVFMGGTLVDRGGHNLLEPAYFGKPVISGPNLQNFPEIAEDFRAHEALLEISKAGQLAGPVRELLLDSGKARRIGEAGKRLTGLRTGATARALTVIQSQYERSVPCAVHGRMARVLLGALASLWAAGAARRRERQTAAAHKLPHPVISVGGIAMGGAGKTPFALSVAEMVRDAGRKPAFLTRGYGRRSRETVIVKQGGTAPVPLTGDEAQILVRSGLADVGIASDRKLAAGHLDAPGRVFILDDGFQHWKLARDADIVLLDSLDPFGGGAVFPLGRLREPLAALGRASAIVLTRVTRGESYAAVEREIRRFNPAAPIFHAELQFGGWLDARSGQPGKPEGDVVAFCGLGNPASFWRTLRQANVATASKLTFADHHTYTPADLHAIVHEAERRQLLDLVTTEKDVMNLPADWPQIFKTRNLWWAKVRLVPVDTPGFVRWLHKQTGLL